MRSGKIPPAACPIGPIEGVAGTAPLATVGGVQLAILLESVFRLQAAEFAALEMLLIAGAALFAADVILATASALS
jgi:hypothetical protein